MVHGALFGALVSFAFYSATASFRDLVGFLAGIVYGILIALFIYYYDNREEKSVDKE